MMRWIKFNVICSLVFVYVNGGNKRYYVTESCGKILGPDQGAHFQFDTKATTRRGTIRIPDHLKGSVFECLIVVRGIPPAGKKRYMSVHWRNFHIRHSELDGFKSSPEACGKAYVTVYKGIKQGSNTGTLANLTMCGKSAIKPDTEFEGEYVSLYFYIDYTVPTRNGSMSIYEYPEVYFKLDITSFDNECTTTVIGKTMKCEQSKRCIDESLRCDFHSSLNCASELFPLDKSDRSLSAPAYCGMFADDFTTLVPVPPKPFNWLPIAAGAGSFMLSLLLCWCCWKPGHCIWWCSRCRNSRCCIWNRARRAKLRPKADTKLDKIPRNAILTRHLDKRCLQVDGFSDSGMSSRANSPVEMQGIPSRNILAIGTSPRLPTIKSLSPIPSPGSNRNKPETGLENNSIGKENSHNGTVSKEIPTQESQTKKEKNIPIAWRKNSKKSSGKGKKIKVAPAQHQVITVTEVDW